MASNNVPAPTWFKVVAIVALVWNLLGMIAFVMQVSMTPEAIAMLPEEQRILYENIPYWVNGAFAAAVFGGTLGCIFLLTGSKLARLAFIVSLIGIALQNFHAFIISKALDVFGAAGLIMPIVVMVVAVYLLLISIQGRQKGWLV